MAGGRPLALCPRPRRQQRRARPTDALGRRGARARSPGAVYVSLIVMVPSDRREPRLRILVTNWNDRTSPFAGGADVHLHQVFGRLVRRGHEVTLLSAGWPGAERETALDGIAVHRTGGRHTFTVAARR